MANSVTFDGTDLQDYGLVTTSYDLPVIQEAQIIRVQNKAYAWRSSLLPKTITTGVIVSATTQALLIAALDDIKSVLNTREDAELIFDILSTRYWNARFDSLTGKFISPVKWRGNLAFTALDPVAFSTTLTESNHNVDADPDTVVETAGGTANTYPIYTLTAGEELGSVEVTIENDTTGYALTWSGEVSNTEELVIDCSDWTVELEGTPSMADVSGRFPYLQPGANSIIVTGWSDTGTLDIDYRARYL